MHVAEHLTHLIIVPLCAPRQQSHLEEREIEKRGRTSSRRGGAGRSALEQVLEEPILPGTARCGAQGRTLFAGIRLI